MEKELARIERGERACDTFRKEIEAYTRESYLRTALVRQAVRPQGFRLQVSQVRNGQMQFYGKVVRCDNTECGLPVFRLKANRTLTDDEIKDLLTDGHTKLLKGFKSKQGKSFDAVVAFDGTTTRLSCSPKGKRTRNFQDGRNSINFATDSE